MTAPEPPALTVDLWTLPLAGVADGLVDSWLPRLGAAERARAERLRVERARREHVAAHALLRHALTRHLGGAPEDWRFGRGSHGKPHLADPPDGRDPRFNISHTHGLVACVIVEGAEVGVDVERSDRRTRLDVAGRYFAAPEVEQLRRARPEARDTLFLGFWTMKEAYIKAIGLGLARPLGGFAFDLERPAGPDGPALQVLDGGPDAALLGGWQFRRARPTADHLLALAVAAGPGREVGLRWHSPPADSLLDGA